MGLKSWLIAELPSKGKLHLGGKGNCCMHAIFLITLLMIMMSYGMSTAVCEYPEINKENILNYLDYNLKRGEEIGLLNVLFTLDSYDILEVEVPNRTQVIAILNSIQSDEGTWATGTIHYVPVTAQVLMFYDRSGVKPAKSLEPFFSTIDTWEKVKAHVNTYNPGNYWGGLWGYVNCYVVYKGESPPWTKEFVDEANEKFDTWAYYNHQRTHLMPNLLQLRKPIPRLDEVINITLQQQKEDGSWDWSEAETVFSIQLLRHIRNQTTICTNLIDPAINRGLEYVRKCYKTVEFEGKTYAGFATNRSEQNPAPRETAEGIWALLNPESDVWSRWFLCARARLFRN